MSASSDLSPLDHTLRRAAAVLGDAQIPFVLGGSVACWARGGPRVTNDVDMMVAPRDAETALRALVEAGFEPGDPPESWLLKARDPDGVWVDLIFEPRGVVVDREFIAGCEEMAVLAMRMPVMRVEDVLVSRLLAMDEHHVDYTAHLAIVRALREQIDWPGLAARVGESPYARGFLALVRELGIGADAEPGPSAATVQVRRHAPPSSPPPR